MKKIIILVMIFCLLISVGVYGTNLPEGKFIKLDGVCVAYQYLNGGNAGWEIVFNKYCKWEDRESLKPFAPEDNNGTWIKYDKNYLVVLKDAKLKGQSELCWSFVCLVDGKQINKGQKIDVKNLKCDIKIEGKKGDDVIYKGSLEDQKLNEIGSTELIVNCTAQEGEAMDYIFNFKAWYVFNFPTSYVPLSPIPSETPIEVIPTSNNTNPLPQTGERDNTCFIIVGLSIILIGILSFGIIKIKKVL